MRLGVWIGWGKGLSSFVLSCMCVVVYCLLLLLLLVVVLVVVFFVVIIETRLLYSS